MNGGEGQNRNTAPALDWRAGGVPVSRRFDDPYFSLSDGLAETRHVFLKGNQLEERLRDGFSVAELGFGTGLNALATARLWADSGRPGRIRFTSFEAWPLAHDDMARALAVWPDLAEVAGLLLEGWSGDRREIRLPGMDLQVIVGDARRTVPAWSGRADAWFLDGFSPARNPELWEESLLREVAAHTAPGGSCATYSAAGAVRARLATAGFGVTRTPGFAGKRHMTSAWLAER